MKKDLLVKIIIVVIILAGLGYFIYVSSISRNKNVVFEARIKYILS